MRDKLKIVHFLICTGHGGDAFTALDLARQQRACGHDARIVIGRGEFIGPTIERGKQYGVPVQIIPQIANDGADRVFPRCVYVWQALRAIRPDVIHFHAGHLVVRSGDILAGKLSGAPVRLATPHASFDWSAWADPTRPQEQWRKAVESLDQVLCVSDWSRAVHSRAGIPDGKLTTLYNPVDRKKLGLGNSTAVRAELGIPETSRVILFLGRLHPDKRPLDALEAFGRIAGEFPDAHLLMAGSGGDEPTCRDTAAQPRFGGRGHVLGFRSDVADLLAAADVYLMTTEFENFSIALLEAMAAGLAVIATPVGGNSELIEHAKTGLLVPVGDVDGFSAALRRLLSDDSLRGKLASAAKDRSSDFSLDTIANNSIEIYRKYLKKGGGRNLSAQP